MELFFWISLFFIFYTYLGYGVLLYLLLMLKKVFLGDSKKEHTTYTPSLTIIVAAYNEADIIEAKIINTLELDYPKELVHYIFITDGSNDKTDQIVSKFPIIKGMHLNERNGKIAAIHRAMLEVATEIVVFTDANTILNKDALINISRHYIDPSVGAIAGEKRVQIENQSDATAGEGFYWKYESKLKQWDSELYSVVGAAGELFSIRSNLYIPVESDTILDDFMISMNIALKGYRIIYEPESFATETASANTSEELKRKIRIAAGGIQSTIRLRQLLIPFKNPVLTFEFISHRVLRWVVTPYLMLIAFLINIILVNQVGIESVYGIVLSCQVFFYLAALLGFIFEKQQIKVKVFFIPYYFCLMNYAVIAGMFRYFFVSQSVLWEKAKRR
jgi:cellulose synthase/poly-beta-1,6-N-acetylglucosamine synthase-like glycosyltransferase